MSRVRNMTEGKPILHIITFALPLMLGNVFQQLYTVVDTMVVGQALGVNALAALGAVDWLNWLMLGIVQGLTQGFAIRMAQEFGAGQIEQLKKTVGNSVTLAGISTVFLLIIGQLVARPSLVLLQTPDAIMQDALLYLRIMYLGVPIVMAYNLLACILRALGDGKTPLHAMIVASFTNIVLDILFVIVFHWGIAGAAAATLIAQVVSGLFCMWHIRRIDILRMGKEHFAMQAGIAGHLFLLGLPMAFQNSIISIGGMVVQTVVNGFGVIFIAGFTATNKLYGLLEIAATSYGYAMTTYVGQNLGAGKKERIQKGVRAAVAVAMVTSIVIAAVMIFFGKIILGWFISGTPEQTTQALQIAYYYLVIMSVCLPILYILHVVRSAIQGMGNTVLPMVSGIAEFVMRAVSALILPRVVGETGIFYAEVLAWLGADVILVASYLVLIRRWKRQEI
ncbi:MAG: MATE family efflux transporter [Lachnospiraceae bacterium]|nr:MATE family efflux transporter [Lachnospiraceae bacterium]